jgi:hypothetical protein
MDDDRVHDLITYTGNYGLAVPAELIVLDADDMETAQAIKRALDERGLAYWMQWTAKGAHFVLRVPLGRTAMNWVKKTKIEGFPVDVRVKGGQIVVEPSVHPDGTPYQWETGKAPWDIPPYQLSVLPGEWLEAEEAEETEDETPGRDIADGQRNDALFRMACAMRKRGFDEEVIETALLKHNTAHCKPPLSEREVQRIVESAARYPEGKHPKEKAKRHYTAVFEGLVDLVQKDGASAFLIKDAGVPKVVTAVDRDGTSLLPPPIENVPFMLPRAEEVLRIHEATKGRSAQEIDSTLFNDLVTFHTEVSDLPSEAHYVLLAAFDMMTYLQEAIEYAPVLAFFAVPERGKSRTGKGITYVAYRGLHVESLRDSYILRVAEDFNATMFFDVRDLWKRAEDCKSEDILLHRFEKGARIPRVLWPDKGPHQDTRYYRVFGPTVVATNEGIHHILETRAVSVTMPDTQKLFDEQVTPLKGLPFKERLVEFRLRHLGETLPPAEKPARGRLGDILRPILQVIRLAASSKEAQFRELVRQVEDGRRTEKAESIEAKIILALDSLKNDVTAGILTVKAVTEALNAGQNDKYKLGAQTVGKRLKALGFEKTRIGIGNAAIYYDESLIDRLKVSHGLKEPSDSSGSSERPPQVA